MPAQTAFVLGGGGVLEANEVGTLRALLEAGVRPDLVAGTSESSSRPRSSGTAALAAREDDDGRKSA